ncbi:hypothetical protein STSP2_02670 [Anaerohalosphaera lusitana]|uniref:Rubrerythrin diiron-binding domain-containing protein n=1 Tax=Anaerohalosphaera lusitana TaxID=1936003 RepID=A0A1U9NNL1_9BACT|nr:ferritin family protein [Anaerohalosphaera lusitana]AQT69479.1 hypothetical protein STSP2_02670 [Anaerohalosphaera lusitana]
MDIFEFAMEKEKMSREKYLDMAEKSKSVGVKHILQMLADEEEKHYHTVERMKQETPEGVTKTDVLADAKKVFEKMQGAREEIKFEDDEKEVYHQAKKIEEEARDYYLQKEKEADDEVEKKIFHRLAEEEQKHWFVIDNICDFVEKPEYYLENAEFVHLDNYVPFP